MKMMLTLCALAICGATTLRAADGDKPKPPGGDGKGRPNPEEIFKKLDTNGDGFISKEEFLAGPRAKQDPEGAAKRFAAMDKKGNGKVTLEEFKGAMEHHGKPGGKPPGDAPKKPEPKQ